MFFIELPTKHLSTALLMFRSLEVCHKAIFVHCFLNAVYMITGFCTKIKYRCGRLLEKLDYLFGGCFNTLTSIDFI
jgi:hypothetical protein